MARARQIASKGAGNGRRFPCRTQTIYRLAFFMPRLVPFLSLDSFTSSSALRFWPAATVPFTLTTVDFPAASPFASFATCASAMLQSAVSLMAYLFDREPSQKKGEKGDALGG